MVSSASKFNSTQQNSVSCYLMPLSLEFSFSPKRWGSIMKKRLGNMGVVDPDNLGSHPRPTNIRLVV